ncbi:hypothetical protein OAX78_02635, partial [Planctomycetota bacterium]|nr:hypothetical protein [Planctomycetota bacterium]
MFFTYPATATKDNWLHESLVYAIQRLLADVSARKRTPKWPDYLLPEHRDALRSRRSLRDRLGDLRKALRGLTQPERDLVAQALESQNKIADLLNCTADCETLDELPLTTRAPIKAIFEKAFGLLTPFGLRDKHYKAIHASLPRTICPFCGCEYFDRPTAKRETLDHYLAESRYPFAGSNLRNLVPMGTKCNTKYKLAKDILRSDSGNRRAAFDPYGANPG